ncbi:hypothetical protein H7X69_00475 [Candidatus Saccharibacteria bacterium]|nr:hypothetical protein [Candidatus Saccharibacteria bacterium]
MERNESVINKNILQTIRDQEMDRKEFLQYSGLVLLGLVGLKTIISLLAKTDDQKLGVVESRSQVTRGFGSGKYGA